MWFVCTIVNNRSINMIFVSDDFLSPPIVHALIPTVFPVNDAPFSNGMRFAHLRSTFVIWWTIIVDLLFLAHSAKPAISERLIQSCPFSSEVLLRSSLVSLKFSGSMGALFKERTKTDHHSISLGSIDAILGTCDWKTKSIASFTNLCDR
ncbi:uncharacterized protein DEA37_0008839 [Paragonimus westermani]|uniref:Uncharacterized protein n=1 Tax=Paragonimus westermani TaxID=34504 RepID=A0A5J4NDW2_9TREM|nr:uncharacterized protein DEA37_0008839 [Paragonimus westermani]